MKSRPKLILILLIPILALSCCGIRPGQLTPPNGEAKDGFPHNYPKDRNAEKIVK